MKAILIVSAVISFMSLVFIWLVKTYSMGRNLTITAIVFIAIALNILFILTGWNFTPLATTVNPDYLVYILILPVIPVIAGFIVLIGLLTYLLETDPKVPGPQLDHKLIDSKINSIYWLLFCAVCILILTQSYVIL